jgi:hypothetical protein
MWGTPLLELNSKEIVKQDDGFRVLRNLRGSPPYWEKAKKDVFAMIRQFHLQIVL